MFLPVDIEATSPEHAATLVIFLILTDWICADVYWKSKLGVRTADT